MLKKSNSIPFYNDDRTYKIRELTPEKMYNFIKTNNLQSNVKSHYIDNLKS